MATYAEWRRRRLIRLRLLAVDPCCWYCGRQLRPETSTLDHFKPRAAGGDDDESNLLLACWRCNRRKADHPIELLACHRRRGIGLVQVKHLRHMRRRAAQQSRHFKARPERCG